MSKFIDLTGKRFCRITVVCLSRIDNRVARWNCWCDCGSKIECIGTNLKRGNTKSCGCLRREVSRQKTITHGQSRTRLYKIWNAMIQRCYSKSSRSWCRYGSRGIDVCNEWRSFEVFRDWSLANGYADNLEIDRIKFNLNYCPSNCRWVNGTQQRRNTRSRGKCKFKGVVSSKRRWSAKIYIDGRTQNLGRFNTAIEAAIAYDNAAHAADPIHYHLNFPERFMEAS